MSEPEEQDRSVAGRSVALGVAVVLGWYVVLRDEAPAPEPRATDKAPPASYSRPTSDPSPLPTSGAEPLSLPSSLPPLLTGEERGAGLDYCDDTQWVGLGSLVGEVRPGEADVEEANWRGLTSSGRSGIASWISKCKLDGAPVRLLARTSGRRLGDYSSEEGYIPDE